VTAQSDLFALGSLLFELVTGRKLWIRDPEDRPVDVFGIGAARKDVARNGPAAVCRRVMFEVRPRLRDYRPDAPAALESLCLSLLDPVADKRPASALAARVALAHALDVPLPPPVRAAYEAALRRAAERTASQLKPDPDATPVAPWAQVAVQPAERSVAIEVSIARPAAAVALVSASAGAGAPPSAPQPGPGDLSRTEPDRVISDAPVASAQLRPAFGRCAAAHDHPRVGRAGQFGRARQAGGSAAGAARVASGLRAARAGRLCRRGRCGGPGGPYAAGWLGHAVCERRDDSAGLGTAAAASAAHLGAAGCAGEARRVPVEAGGDTR
jgi:hypothetical protein